MKISCAKVSSFKEIFCEMRKTLKQKYPFDLSPRFVEILLKCISNRSLRKLYYTFSKEVFSPNKKWRSNFLSTFLWTWATFGFSHFPGGRPDWRQFINRSHNSFVIEFKESCYIVVSLIYCWWLSIGTFLTIFHLRRSFLCQRCRNIQCQDSL